MLQFLRCSVHVIWCQCTFFLPSARFEKQHLHSSLLITNALSGQCTFFTLFLLFTYRKT